MEGDTSTLATEPGKPVVLKTNFCPGWRWSWVPTPLVLCDIGPWHHYSEPFSPFVTVGWRHLCQRTLLRSRESALAGPSTPSARCEGVGAMHLFTPWPSQRHLGRYHFNQSILICTRDTCISVCFISTIFFAFLKFRMLYLPLMLFLVKPNSKL